MNRKKLLKERKKLANYIDDLKKSEDYTSNQKKKEAKDKYNFINNLLKIGI